MVVVVHPGTFLIPFRLVSIVEENTGFVAVCLSIRFLVLFHYVAVVYLCMLVLDYTPG